MFWSCFLHLPKNYQLVLIGNRIPQFITVNLFSHSDLLMSLQRGVYCPGETIKLNLQYKYVEARKMGLVKCRLNKYKRLNKKENKNIYKKTVKEQNGRFEHH